MTDRPSLKDLDVELEPARWCCAGNAEDCPLCTDPNPPYPFICPGHPQTAANERIVGEATQATQTNVQTSLRQQYAHAIRDKMLFGLQDAELHDEPGRARILEWVDWISKAVAEVSARREQRLTEAHRATIGELRAAEARVRELEAILGLDRILDAQDSRQSTRHVHITVRNTDEYTANRQALSLVDFLRAEFDGLDVTTDAREWGAADEEVDGR